jgi:hypothetical protein
MTPLIRLRAPDVNEDKVSNVVLQVPVDIRRVGLKAESGLKVGMGRVPVCGWNF